ncbi:histidine phosphatase family protein (plasmid) [Paracoccus sp. Arc7-R13]|uniref:histidine phosphatase family protein n=1 Tax=Paracoccus sp. Arc7-R13 TaxID=2500532 RepID=UPI000FDBC03E|nr:histidine phosphatase family protein [Paracoccus sp. Arc7-R13]AZY95587.1 histidine phosphatase family protein [Paracoccus sp. Arc7-R13]
MAPAVRYLTHPQILIEPTKDSRSWSLNSTGALRVARLASRQSCLQFTRHIVSSPEKTAMETATPLAQALGLVVDIRENMREHDRSSTGFLSKRELEQASSAYFSQPERSVRGWEAASAAQRRIMSEVDACLDRDLLGDVLIVGHGGVGALLYCGLSGHAIDRDHVQDMGGGVWFEFDSILRLPLKGWRPMEAL